MDLISEIIFWSSYLIYPFLLLCFYFLIRTHQTKSLKLARLIRGFWSLMIILALVFIEARFFEPQMLNTTRESVYFFRSEGDIAPPGKKSMRVAVVGDLHLGVYKKQDFLKKVVDRINAEDVDMVLLVGDFVYMANENQLEDLFEPLLDLEATSYGVLGNHDYGMGKEADLSRELLTILEDYGVKMIDNEVISEKFDNMDFKIVGIGDLDGRNARVETMDLLEKDDKKVLLITHNPDVVTMVPEGSFRLAVTGHTHCGQIRLPGYKNIIPTKGDFDGGMSKFQGGKLFITCGAGESLLPLRFFNFPEINILELH